MQKKTINTIDTLLILYLVAQKRLASKLGNINQGYVGDSFRTTPLNFNRTSIVVTNQRRGGFELTKATT